MLEETIRNSHSSSSFPLGNSISKLAVDIAEEVEACEDTSLRACIFKTLFNVLTAGNVLTCDDNLRKLVNFTLTALANPASLATDAQRFCLKVTYLAQEAEQIFDLAGPWDESRLQVLKVGCAQT